MFYASTNIFLFLFFLFTLMVKTHEFISKKQAIAISILSFMLFPYVSALGLIESYAEVDNTNDTKVFDSEFYDAVEIDYDKPLDTIQDAFKDFDDNFYDETVSKDLTNNQKTDYGYMDFTEFTIEDITKETATIIFTMNGNLDNDENSFIVFCWNNPSNQKDQMLLASGYSLDIDTFLTLDLINDVAYESEFNDETFELITYKVDSEYLFTDESMNFMVIGMMENSTNTDVIVDLFPNTTNWTLIGWIIIITVILVVSAIAIVYIIKKR